MGHGQEFLKLIREIPKASLGTIEQMVDAAVASEVK